MFWLIKYFTLIPSKIRKAFLESIYIWYDHFHPLVWYISKEAVDRCIDTAWKFFISIVVTFLMFVRQVPWSLVSKETQNILIENSSPTVTFKIFKIVVV